MVDGKSFFIHSRRTAVLFAVILVAVLVSSIIYAYYWSLPPQKGPRLAVESPPLEFAIEIDKTDYSQGENVSILLTLTNIGNETISISWPVISFVPPPSNGTFSFHVTDANESLVYDWLEFRGNLTMVLVRTLDPRDTLSASFVWEQQTRTGQYEPRFVPALKGEYAIRGYTSTFALRVGEEIVHMSLETPTISFAII